MSDSSAYPAASPHGKVEEIFTDLFFVQGSIDMGRGAKFNRNMIIIRDGVDLTLINAVRLKDDRPITDLGTIKHVIRLGCFHGLDDPYYVEKYGAEFWSLDKQHSSYKDTPHAQTRLAEGVTLPFAGGDLIEFHQAKWGEAAILLKRHGGVLITCDAIQHHRKWTRASIMTRLMLPFLGFTKTTLIGPLWLKAMTPEGASLKEDFDRILNWDFKHGIGAHGQVCRDDAHDQVAKAISNAFS